MSEISVEKFEKLQNKLKRIEPKLSEFEGIRKTKRAQIDYLSEVLSTIDNINLMKE